MATHLIIGGSDAGISAALRIKELVPDAQVLLFLKDAYPNYSICGIPFFLSGEVADWSALAHRTLATIAAAGITVHASEPVLAVDVTAKTVTTARATYAYDKLLLATGATSVLPPIAGAALPAPPTRPRLQRLLGSGAGSPLLPVVATEGRPRSRVSVAAPAGPPSYPDGCWPNRLRPVPPAECLSRLTAGNL